jgi:serine/threonine protein kinase
MFLSDPAAVITFSDTVVRQALINRYEVIEKIGRGGMGVVYKAIQKNLDRPVALKILLQQFTSDQEFLKRFHWEARNAAQLNHPNIITIYDEGVENGVHFIAMEYIEGEDLRSIILEEGPLPVERMLKLIKPVVDALDFAHKRKLIHRDIKSANILISKDGHSVLTDFGIARALDYSQLTRSADSAPLTRPGTIVGTLQYMSPEQVQTKPVDGRSDIYSLGVVMYHCLTGELPFRADTDWSTMHKIASEPPTPPRGIRADIPKQVEQIILRCMAKDPANRYQSCNELAAAIIQVTKALESEGLETKYEVKTKAKPMGEIQAWKNKVMLSPARIKMAAGVISLALVMLVILLVLGKGKEPPNPSPPPEVTKTDGTITDQRSKIPVLEPREKKPMSEEPSAAPPDKIIDDLLKKAKQLVHKKNWKSAWDTSAEIVKQSPGETRATDLQKQIMSGLRSDLVKLSRQGEFRQAVDHLKLIKQLDPTQNIVVETTTVYEEWGDYYMRQGDYGEAIKKYEIAKTINPNDKNFIAKLQEANARIIWLGIEFVFVKGDTFAMGDVWGDGEEDERPVHSVQVNDFYISKHEVTFAQYDTFCEAAGRRKPGDNGWGRGQQPVINVSWHEAMAFCEWLAKRTGKAVRLPTEAEWEYAARDGGKSMKWAGTNSDADLDEYGWHTLNGDSKTHPVGKKRPNNLGVYDMSGNAYEWCLDRYDEDYYKKSPQNNPKGPSKGKKFVLRGGSSHSARVNLRCASRSSIPPDKCDFPTGFRVVRFD